MGLSRITSRLAAVMSVRYSEMRRESVSKEYVRAVMRFIGSDTVNRSVLEVAAGGTHHRAGFEKGQRGDSIDLSE